MAMEGEDYISHETLIQFIEITHNTTNINPSAHPETDLLPFDAALERFEADLLRGLLKKHKGNIDAAAHEAHMNMATMYRKIKKYGIRKEEYL